MEIEAKGYNKLQPDNYLMINSSKQGAMPSTNAELASLHVIEPKDTLNVHPTESVEKPTQTEKIYRPENTWIIYKLPVDYLGLDFYRLYYGINVNTKGANQ